MNSDRHLCIVCGERGRARCGRCKSVNYCGAEHQKSHWSVHKTQCKKENANTYTRYVKPEVVPAMQKAATGQPMDAKEKTGVQDFVTQMLDKDRKTHARNLESLWMHAGRPNVLLTFELTGNGAALLRVAVFSEHSSAPPVFGVMDISSVFEKESATYGIVDLTGAKPCTPQDVVEVLKRFHDEFVMAKVVGKVHDAKPSAAAAASNGYFGTSRLFYGYPQFMQRNNGSMHFHVLVWCHNGTMPTSEEEVKQRLRAVGGAAMANTFHATPAKGHGVDGVTGDTEDITRAAQTMAAICPVCYKQYVVTEDR